MEKICNNNPAHHFDVTDADMAFYAKMDVPPPTLCPPCRMQRRMSFRHGGKLYERKCDLTGKEIIAMYPASAPFPVYDQEEWWGDAWDGTTYGRDVDWLRPFMEQFSELLRAVPHIALLSTNSENCRYTNHLLNSKNCYLVIGGSYNEDCYYGHFVNRSRSSMDCLSVANCERCYWGTGSQDCYDCAYFTDSRSCTDCLLIDDCQSCHNCIGCVGLKNAEYHVLNQPVGRQQYEEIRRSITPLTPSSLAKLRNRFEPLRSAAPKRFAQIYQCEDSTGDNLFSCQGCRWAFDSRECRDSSYLCFTPKAEDSYDCTFNAPDGVRSCYEALSTVGAYGCISTNIVWTGNDVLYSQECHHCSNLFGCVGLKRRQYCILNKQYTKEEYERLLPKLKNWMREQQVWGEYFDQRIALFPYNDSIAQDYFPLTAAEVEEAGLRWRKEEVTSAYHGTAEALPERVTDATDALTRSILPCRHCGHSYKIIPQELRFLRESGLPLPQECFPCRHAQRLQGRNPRMLYHRTCAKCRAPLTTTYAPDRQETVYCEQCYQEAVY